MVVVASKRKQHRVPTEATAAVVTALAAAAAAAGMKMVMAVWWGRIKNKNQKEVKIEMVVMVDNVTFKCMRDVKAHGFYFGIEAPCKK